MASGDTKTNQYLDIAANGTRADLPSDTCCETRTQSLIRGVAERIMDVEDEVEEIKNNPDVVDIVPTYAALQNYDTSTLTDKDIIRVLQDETHDGDSTYYRYNAQSDTWTYVGESKQYEEFVGTDGTTAGEAGLVPAPAATDAGKVLGANGTWVTGGPTVVQSPGTSTTDVMSQNAVTSMVFADPTTKSKIRIGNMTPTAEGNGAITIRTSGVGTTSAAAIAIGNDTQARSNSAIALGSGVDTGENNNAAVGIGFYSGAYAPYSVAMGAESKTRVQGEFSIGDSTKTKMYNGTGYRLLTNVYDGQSAHDAATYGQLSTAILNGGTTAPTTATVGAVGTLYSYVDTTGTTPTPHLMVCTVADTATPEYTWVEVGGGSTVEPLTDNELNNLWEEES